MTGAREQRRDAHSHSAVRWMTDFSDLAGLKGGKAERARLKVDPASGINLLSAHRYFGRQALGPERQTTAKSLIELVWPGDSLICPESCVQLRQFSTESEIGEALR